MSCHDHRPWQYASRGGGFDPHIADIGRNDKRIRQVGAVVSGGGSVCDQPKVRNNPEIMMVSAIETTAATTATCRMRKLRVVPSNSFRFPPTGGSESNRPLGDVELSTSLSEDFFGKRADKAISADCLGNFCPVSICASARAALPRLGAFST